MSDPEAPIACTLSPAAFGERVQTIAALSARNLRSARRDGRRLHLTFALGARADVEDLVRKEQACCAFLDFELSATPDAVELTITVPERAADDAETLLSPFLPKTGCACC